MSKLKPVTDGDWLFLCVNTVQNAISFQEYYDALHWGYCFSSFCFQ